MSEISFRELGKPATGFPRRLLLGSWVNRGIGGLLTDCLELSWQKALLNAVEDELDG
jgi:hypothetical protein